MSKPPSIDFHEVYCGRRVLVTGHTGFKGSWLSAWLHKLGAEVSGISLPPATQPNLFEATGLQTRMVSGYVDIRHKDALRSAISRTKPEIVMHLAAQALVRRSYEEPLETFETNVLGTANLLQACRDAGGVDAIVCVTTDKVYLNQEWNWPYRETDRLGGLDPYSASKACAELVAYVYQRNLFKGTDNPRVATVRGGNVIGGGDWSADRIVPDILRAISAGQPIQLRNPAAIRPWQHVLELCEGYLEIGARLAAGDKGIEDAWNFGPRASNEVTVNNLVRRMLDVWGKADWPVTVESSPLHEAQLLRLDISKALASLNWRPRLNIDQTIAWTAHGYKAFDQLGADLWDVTSSQIDEFTALRAASDLPQAAN